MKRRTPTYYLLPTTYSSSGGFTLIELLVFAAIFSGMMIAFISVLVVVTGIQSRQASVAEVNQQSQFLLQQIGQLTERSSLIEIPQDAVTSTLKLRMPASAEDPTYITLSNGVVYLQQTATGTPNPLTSSKVTVSSLNFTKRSNPPGHDSVAVSFLVSYNTLSVKQQFSEILNTAVARVSAATFDSNVIPSSTATYDLGVSSQLWRSVNGLIYFSSGNVGIGSGNSSPVSQLDLAGAQTFRGMSAPATSSVGQAVLYYDSSANQLKLSQNAGAYANLGAGPWNTSGTAIYYNAGNVGIGTTNPSLTGSGLHILGTSDAMIKVQGAPAASGNAYFVGLPTGSGNVYFTNASTSANSYFGNGSAAAQQMVILQSGNVGIGTTGPGTLLDVRGVGNFQVASKSLQIRSGASGSNASFTMGRTGDEITFGLASAANQYTTGDAAGDMTLTGGGKIFLGTVAGAVTLTLNQSGNVGIGTTAPTAQLELSTDSAKKPTTNTWTIASDARIKTDVNTFTDGLDTVLKIRPITYKYNGLGGPGYSDTATHIGIIAQELEPVAPYMVETGTGTIAGVAVNDFKSYQGHALPFILVNAIKEQQKEIEELKARLAELETGGRNK